MSTAAVGTAHEKRFVPEWTFADRIRKVRYDVLGVQQAEMAQRLNVNKSAYSAWEAGRTTPRNLLAIARQIETVSGVSAAWILGVNSDEPTDGTHPDRAYTGSQIPDNSSYITGAGHPVGGHLAPVACGAAA